MNIHHRAYRMIVVSAVTAGLTGASMLTCGSAHANGLTEILDDMGRIAVRQLRVPPPVAARRVDEAVLPAVVAARGSGTDFRKITKAACTVNKIWDAGGVVYDTFFDDYSSEERDAVLQQARQLSATGMVDIVCSLKFK